MKSITKEVVLEYIENNKLTGNELALLKAAKETLATSYSPYSNFPVAAAVLMSNGALVKGSNQENAAYPSGLCAERVALFYAASKYPKETVEQIAICVSPSHPHIPYPCGSCLQVMAEMESRQASPIKILLIQSKSGEVYRANGVKNLLPFAFEKKHLESTNII